ncbi:predicted protein [Histoplasma capsulatum H143]|uniref:Uncharacterized protein n=1 Tax=Ajellomyces capsulatus (strain H143) TaxID=544712 RepID=C6HQZ9_AJECH|nr:predicted protein [Histoplasma capsulatum H143]
MSLCLGCHTLGRCQPLWTSCSDDGALDRSSRSLGVCVLAAVTSGEETRCGDQSGFSAHPVGLTCLGSKRTYDEALVHLCRQPPSGEQVIECGECHDDQEQQTSRGRNVSNSYRPREFLWFEIRGWKVFCAYQSWQRTELLRRTPS